MIVPAAFLLFIQSAAGAATSTAAVPQPAPGPAHGPERRGAAASLFAVDDYPAKAAGTGAHGKVVARLTVGASGRVVACSIVRSSGFPVLDDATCEILQRRSRYGPPVDRGGRPVEGTIDESITWIAP